MAVIRADAVRSEEGAAAFGAVMALSAASGAMVSLIEIANGSLALVAVPTLVLLGMLVTRSARSGYAAAGLWILIVPMAHGVAIVAPLMMVVLCLAFAVGPERLADWMRDEWTGRESHDVPDDAAWIEDDLTIR